MLIREPPPEDILQQRPLPDPDNGNMADIIRERRRSAAAGSGKSTRRN